MKKKLLAKYLCIVLSATMAMGSVPVSAATTSEAEVQVIDVNAEAKAEEENAEADETATGEAEIITDDIAEETEDAGEAAENNEIFAKEEYTEEEVTECSIEDLMSMDFTNMSDEEFSDVIKNTSFIDIAIFLDNTSEKTAEVVKERLKDETIGITTFIPVDTADTADMVEYENSYKEMSYLDYCYKLYDESTQNVKAFNQKTGKFSFHVKRPDNTNYNSTNFTVSVENLGTKTAQALTITQSPAGNVTFNKLTTSNASSTSYMMFTTTYSYTKGIPNHRITSATFRSRGTGRGAQAASSISAAYDGNPNETKITGTLSLNLAYEANMGCGNGGTFVAADIDFASAVNEYNVTYDGNGATSGSIATQTIANNDSSKVVANNGFARSYTVTYDANGGTSDKANDVASYTFNGWKYGNSDVAAGTTISSATGLWTWVHGGTVALKANWNSASVKLPNATKSFKVSYNANGGNVDVPSATVNATFNGWQGAGGAGASYTPTSNVTLNAQWGAASTKLPGVTRTGYTFKGWSGNGASSLPVGQNVSITGDTTYQASWSPNNYTITLTDPSGTNTNLEDVAATYDANVQLPIIERTGYSFGGWKSNTSTYTVGADGTITVKNLTPDNGAVVSLTAVWEAEDVTYKIIREKETYADSNAFVPLVEETDGQKAEETATAKAGSQITVPAGDMNGNYITPDAQLVTIAPDGSTVVKFQYKVKKEIVIPDNPGPAEIPEDLKNDIKAINEKLAAMNVADITEEMRGQIATILSTILGLDQSITLKLVELIQNTPHLSEADKKAILQAIMDGYISEDQRVKLLAAIQASGLSDMEKQLLIDKINKLNNLSLAEQKLLLDLLNGGSSATYTANGITYTIIKNPDGTISIGLKGLNGQKVVVIPDSITLAGKTFAVSEISKESFKNNSLIEKVVMGNNVTKIGDSAFENCKNLKEVVFGPSVKEIGKRAFYGCSSLTKVDIPASVLKIGDSAFENCTKIKTVVLHSGLMQIGKKAFYNCKALTSITIPKSVVKILPYAFAKCIKLKSVKFASDSLLLTLGTGAFMDCKILAKITLPKKLTQIPNSAFKNCAKLATVSGGTAVTKIGASAFENCKKLKSFTVQAKVQIIYKKAFYNCSSLKTITIKSKALTSVQANAAKKCHKNLKIKCPNSKISAYNKLWKGKY